MPLRLSEPSPSNYRKSQNVLRISLATYCGISCRCYHWHIATQCTQVAMDTTQRYQHSDLKAFLHIPRCNALLKIKQFPVRCDCQKTSWVHLPSRPWAEFVTGENISQDPSPCNFRYFAIRYSKLMKRNQIPYNARVIIKLWYIWVAQSSFNRYYSAKQHSVTHCNACRWGRPRIQGGISSDMCRAVLHSVFIFSHLTQKFRT